MQYQSKKGIEQLAESIFFILLFSWSLIKILELIPTTN
jgi:hypothetical protein